MLSEFEYIFSNVLALLISTSVGDFVAFLLAMNGPLFISPIDREEQDTDRGWSS